MYLLLAALVLVLLFAASYGGPETWITLASTALTVLLVAGFALVADAPSAARYFNMLAHQSPTFLQAGIKDLSYTAERLASARSKHAAIADATPQGQQPLVEAEPASGAAPIALAPSGSEAGWFGYDWSGLNPTSWLSAVSWLNPLTWFENESPQSVEVEVTTAEPDTTASLPTRDVQEAPLPKVRALMPSRENVLNQNADKREATTQTFYKIITAPPAASGPDTAPLPGDGAAPVQWLQGPAASGQPGDALLTGTNTSDQPLEDILATLKPDSTDPALSAETVPLTLHIETQDRTAMPASTIPPGARFHLKAAIPTKDGITRPGAAIVSFAHSKDGQRRTSIMYLKQTDLAGR